jgi:ABC-type glycerol-3-phosphate transport system substrate-binding protein
MMVQTSQIKRTIIHTLACAATLFFVSACDGANGVQIAASTPTPPNPTIEPLAITSTMIVTPAMTVAPEVTPDPSALPITRLRVWLPEPLAPIDSAAARVIEEQIAAFAAANRDINIEIRLRRPTDRGGLLATLRTASAVAPGALPDLVLLSRADLLIAYNERLIQPLAESGALTTFAPRIDDMPPAVAALGRGDDALIGVPYAVDVQQIAYYPAFVAPEAWTFDGVIADGVRFAFPAARGAGRSDMFTAQILAAGAENDPESFVNLLRFYERANEDDLIDPASLDALIPLDYRARLANGELRAGVVMWRDAMALVAADPSIAFAPIPTADGERIAPLDGWVWAIPTPDVGRAMAAGRLIEWLLDPERHAAYLAAAAYLPATRSALRLWEGEHGRFAESLLDGAILPETLSPTMARAMHTALIAVLTGERTAEQAAQDVFVQAGGGS